MNTLLNPSSFPNKNAGNKLDSSNVEANDTETHITNMLIVI